MRRTCAKSALGFSLVEVIIAIVILGLAGAALINGITSSNLGSRKANDKALAFAALTAYGEAIASASFATCNENLANPYSSISKPTVKTGESVAISSVSGLIVSGAYAGQWKDCGSGWPTSEKASLVQKVKIAYLDASGATKFTRSITKTFGGTQAQYGERGDFRVASMSPVGVVAGAATRTNIALSVSGIPDADNNPATVDQLLFYIMAGSATLVDPQLSESGGNWTLSIIAPASATGHTTVEIGAFDVSKSVYAIPTTLSVSILQPIVLTAGTGTTAANPIVGAFGCPLRTIPFQFSATGGDGTIAFATTSTNFTMTNSGGLSWLPNTGTTCGSTGLAAGSYTIPVTMTSGGLSASTNVYVNLRSRFTAKTNTSCSGFRTSTTGCSVSFSWPAGTGTGTPTVTSPASVNITSGPTVSYDSATDIYSVSIGIKYVATNGFLCKTASATTGSTTFSLTDAGANTVQYSATQTITVSC